MTGLAARLAALLQRSLPEGALVIGASLAAQGVSAYAYLAIASRALGPTAYSPLSALWALIFVAAPGLFLPLEQEAGRAISARRVRGVGARPVIVRAAALGAGLVLALIVIALAAHQPVTDRLFDGDGLLLLGLVVAIICYSSYFLFRGTLAGNGRFNGYATLLAIEASVRVVLTLALALAGVRSAWVFALAIGVPCVIALVPMLLREHGLAEPGPPATWTEISSALTQLLAGSLLAQVLSNISPLAVKVIATDSGAGGRFLDNLIVARVPLFFFQAVQASLLPKLAAQAAAHHYAEFAALLRRLLALLIAVIGVSILGMLAVGPSIVKALFGSGYELGRLDLALLAAGSEGMMLCFSLAQGCIALRAYGRMVAGWAAGITTVGVLLAVLPGVERRAELSFMFGVAAASMGLAAALATHLRTLMRVEPLPQT